LDCRNFLCDAWDIRFHFVESTARLLMHGELLLHFWVIVTYSAATMVSSLDGWNAFLVNIKKYMWVPWEPDQRMRFECTEDSPTVYCGSIQTLSFSAPPRDQTKSYWR
jgi:hypothetical protein